MSSGLYSGQPGLSLGTGLYRTVSSLWSGASGLTMAFGGAGMTLSLDFTTQTYSSKSNSRTFNQLIDFTRTSAATYVDATGKIVPTPASRNLLTFTQEFDNAAWGKNNATVTVNAATAPDGTLTADALIENTANSGHNTSFSRSSSALATFSFYAKASTRSWIYAYFAGYVAGAAWFNLATGTIGTVEIGITAAITSVGNGWYRCSITKLNASNSSGVAISMTTGNNNGAYTGDGTSGIYLWGAQLEANTTATDYTRNVGGVFPPRFDYDPVTLAPKGLLVEEQRTNLLLRSEEFNNASWAKTLCTVVANDTVSPDGTADADKLVANNGVTLNANDSGGGVLQLATVSASAAWTFSVYAKAGEVSSVRLREAATTGARAVVSLTDGSVVYEIGSSASMAVSAVSVGNGWWRIIATRTTGVGETQSAVTIKQGSTTGDGTSGIFIWGAQLEAGAFATSYIPTVASQVTRTADLATMTGTNFSQWYNQSAGTIVAEFDYSGGTSASSPNSRFVLDINASGSANNRNSIYNRSSNAQGSLTFDGGVEQSAIAVAGSISANVVAKAAYAFAANDFAFSLNGSAVSTDTSGTVPTTVNRMTIGSALAGDLAQINGHIRSIKYFPVRLSNAQLQALTA